MNIAALIAVIWSLESSFGMNTNHPDPACHGHLGISNITIRDLNERRAEKGIFKKWTEADAMDISKSFEMAKEHISNYRQKSWTAKEILLFWKCGIKGMGNPSKEEEYYAEQGVWLFKNINTRRQHGLD